jgi:hypothetical protein
MLDSEVADCHESVFQGVVYTNYERQTAASFGVSQS